MLLMLANPSIIVSLAAVFAALGLGEGPPRLDAAWIGIGVLAGSTAWWLVFRLIAAGVGGRVSGTTLRTIDPRRRRADLRLRPLAVRVGHLVPLRWSAHSTFLMLLDPPGARRHCSLTPLNAPWDILKTLSDPPACGWSPS